jgi:hypothetical protein
MSQIGTGSYSSSDWTWTVNMVPVDGFSESGYGSFKFNMDAATVKQGADNSVGVSQQTGSRVGTIELPLMQTSLSNNWLWSLCQLQRARIPGTRILVNGRNSRSGETVIMPAAVFTKTPDASMGKEIEDRTWEFQGLMEVTYAGYVV